ncbi:alpha/beta hydrolase [Streptomyces sp. GMY02]|uniref:alpha/beta fold hydrolase n=1 Tax=Streptomyces sp. GMY02 TaxID=1333528 RepID=UPI001C2B9E62|nr:alpha/beta hydrolase [Streptomyces sp. GMY02]QXE33110.1 alpha/beta hydrolase [Streptomyces sp. GMY02]
MPIDTVLAQGQEPPSARPLIPGQEADEGTGPGTEGGAGAEAGTAGITVEERDLSFDGFRYTCRVVRNGERLTEPLLVLGGSSQDRNSWIRHEKWLGPLGEVITVDLPGYGTADFLPASYGVDFLAAAVRQLLTELDVPRVNLVAACYGGAVGLRFAQHCPGMLARLLLVGMTTRIPADYAAAMERWAVMIDQGETDSIARELADRFMSPPGTGRVRKHAAVSRLVYQQIAGQDPEQLRKSAEHNTRLMRHEWYRPEPVPAVPSLVVTGEYDTLCTPEMGREVAAQLPRARFMTIDETDHLAPVERIADFADLVVRFCTDRPLDGLPYCSRPETLGTSVAVPVRP